MYFIRNIIFGAIIGIANIVPGVSGGTMAVILNIYDKLIYSISNFTENIKGNLKFLVNIGIGGVLGILFFSKSIGYLLNFYYISTNFFFIGLILGSLPMIYQKAKSDKFKISYLVCFLIFLFIIILTGLLSSLEDNSSIIRSVGIPEFLWLITSSIVAAACMIIPGISGSFILLLFGVYSTAIVSISEFNFPIIFIIGIGCVIGFLGGAKIIGFLLEKYPSCTYFSILGLVIGSVPIMFFSTFEKGTISLDFELFISVIFLILGFFISYLLDSDKLKKYFNISNL